MKKIVPFKKELTFKTNLSEITSISLEHNLHLIEGNVVTGSFTVTGDYKIADSSTNTEKFNFELPFDINIDEKYVTDNIIVDIDDFYYEIIDNKALSINIEVLIDKLEEKPLIIKEIIEQPEMSLDIEKIDNKEEERCYEEEDEFPFKEISNIEAVTSDEKEGIEVNPVDTENMKSLFDNFNDTSETYATYRVYIVRENDTIDTVIQRYNITKEELSFYNDLNELKIGDKLIIPSLTNAKI